MTADAGVPVRPAATLLLLRDGPIGVEVCMLQRQHRSEFVPGMYVFPGGAVDDADADPRWKDWVSGLDDAEASSLLQIEQGGLAYWVAAVRETIEESALFPLRRVDGAPLELDGAAADRFDTYRLELDTGTIDLLSICEAEGLQLDAGGMRYFARWITPKGPPRRYDTRFFVAEAPAGQVVTPDGRETISARWVHPVAALDEAASGIISMLPPTIESLRWLSHFDSVADAMAAAIDTMLGEDAAGERPEWEG